jgi:hypothetical protein
MIAAAVAAADFADESEPLQLAPLRGEGIMPPLTPIDVLRQCKPSRELLGLLSRESVKAAEAGNVDDASALLALALCVREVIHE